MISRGLLEVNVFRHELIQHISSFYISNFGTDQIIEQMHLDYHAFQVCSKRKKTVVSSLPAQTD